MPEGVTYLLLLKRQQKMELKILFTVKRQGLASVILFSNNVTV